MIVFVAWLILLAISWPLALLGLILLPIVWLVSIPLRVVGIGVRGGIDAVEAVVLLPGRILRGRPRD